MGTGPPGDGVLHTSGIVAIDIPPLALWQRLRLLMFIVSGMASVEQGGGLFQQGGGAERGAGAAAPRQSHRAFGVAARPGGEGQSQRERAGGGTHVAPTFG